MSMVADHQEHDRIRRLSPFQASTLTEFVVVIRADREITGEEVAALISQRFPFIALSDARVSQTFAEAS